MKISVRKLVPAVAVASLTALSLSACDLGKPEPAPQVDSSKSEETTAAPEPEAPSDPPQETDAPEEPAQEPSQPAAEPNEPSEPAQPPAQPSPSFGQSAPPRAQGGSDQARCISVVTTIQSEGKQLENAQSNPQAAIRAMDEAASKIKTAADGIRDAKSRQAAQSLGTLFDTMASAARGHDVKHLQSIADRLSRPNSPDYRNAQVVEACANGQ